MKSAGDREENETSSSLEVKETLRHSRVGTATCVNLSWATIYGHYGSLFSAPVMDFAQLLAIMGTRWLCKRVADCWAPLRHSSEIHLANRASPYRIWEWVQSIQTYYYMVYKWMRYVDGQEVTWPKRQIVKASLVMLLIHKPSPKLCHCSLCATWMQRCSSSAGWVQNLSSAVWAWPG